jgi:hypothetical protein
MITSDDKVYSQLVDDVFTSLDREVGQVLEGVVPNGAAPLKLYLLTIPDPIEVPYLSVYDFCLVAAYSEDEARRIHPMNKEGCNDMWGKPSPWGDYYWVPLDKVDLIQVTEVGTANGDIVPGVVRASLRHA